MKDGYYLSTYLYINELAYLTRHELRHDQNISLWKKDRDRVEMVHYWELERVTGLKQHAIAFPAVGDAVDLINQLLRPYELTIGHMQEVWGTPQLDTCDDYHSLADYPELCYHSLCHLFSSLLVDTQVFHENDIICLAVDGAPDNVVDLNIDAKPYYAGCYSRRGQMIDVFPIYSPGVMWSLARELLKLREGTLMALASACRSELLESPLHHIWVREVGDVRDAVDDMRLLLNHVESIGESGPGKLVCGYDPRFDRRNNELSMIMKEVQSKSVAVMERNLDGIIEKYNVDTSVTYLALAGGYALNCPTNSYLMSKYGFKGFLACPCVNDGGMSMGVALYAFYKKLKGRPFQFKLGCPYRGDSSPDTRGVLANYRHFVADISELDYEALIRDILDYPIVWFNGAAEIGPRALGNRSILADPRSAEVKDLLNHIKQREWWRPVAPVVLEHEMENWFDGAYPSPFMLHTFRLKDGKEVLVPAIAHLDNSARVQTVNERDNPLLFRILQEFNSRCGVPMLCNTSLNDRGEPIVSTIDELVNFVLRKGIPIAYVNGLRVVFQNHGDCTDVGPASRGFDFDGLMTGTERERRMAELNPHNVSRELLGVYVQRPKLYDRLDLTVKRDIRILEGIAKVTQNEMHIL